MRFGLNAKSVANVEEVGSSLITTRKVIFVPSADIKQELKDTSINITCYDRNGKVVNTVTSADPGEVEDNENPNSGNADQGGTENQGGTDNQGGSNDQGGSTDPDGGLGD